MSASPQRRLLQAVWGWTGLLWLSCCPQPPFHATPLCPTTPSGSRLLFGCGWSPSSCQLSMVCPSGGEQGAGRVAFRDRKATITSSHQACHPSFHLTTACYLLISSHSLSSSHRVMIKQGFPGHLTGDLLLPWSVQKPCGRTAPLQELCRHQGLMGQRNPTCIGFRVRPAPLKLELVTKAVGCVRYRLAAGFSGPEEDRAEETPMGLGEVPGRRHGALVQWGEQRCLAHGSQGSPAAERGGYRASVACRQSGYKQHALCSGGHV